MLITGCSSGFGELTAKTLSRAGHLVFGTMRDIAGRNREPAEQLQTWATETGARLRVVEMDVTDGASVNACVASVLGEAGSLDVVINNAAIAASGPLEAFTIQQVQSLIDTNVLGPLRVNQAVLPHMRARRAGLIVHVSSTLGRVLPRTGGLYPSSKWAVEGFAESLRYEVERFGVEVSIVEPGSFPTPAVARGLRPERTEIVDEYAAPAGNPARNRYGSNPPDPQMVADALLELIELPPGTRPLRTVVGTVFTEGVAEYNAKYEQVRDHLRETLDRLE